MFYRLGMPEADKLTPAGPTDLADALAFALRLHGRKRVQNADEIMAEIVAKACEALGARGLRDNAKATDQGRGSAGARSRGRPSHPGGCACSRCDDLLWRLDEPLPTHQCQLALRCSQPRRGPATRTASRPAQVRNAKPQAESGNPAMVIVGRALGISLAGRWCACAAATLA